MVFCLMLLLIVLNGIEMTISDSEANLRGF